jgi:putative transposase
VVTPAARREATTYLRRTFEMKERRACRVIGTDPTSERYRGVRPEDGALRERLKALAQERRRFGYRRLHVLLRREGHAVNRKRVQRLYREERLTLRRRGGRKRAMGTRRPIETPLAPNQRWSLDFVSDQLTGLVTATIEKPRAGDGKSVAVGGGPRGPRHGAGPIVSSAFRMRCALCRRILQNCF